MKGKEIIELGNYYLLIFNEMFDFSYKLWSLVKKVVGMRDVCNNDKV